MKNCIMYTVKNTPTYFSMLQRSLSLFKNNLNPWIDNPDLIMIPDPGAEQTIENIVRSLGLTNKLIFRKFPNVIPEYPEEIRNKIESVLNDPTIHGSEKPGYKHMCRYWAGLVFKEDIIQEYDYFLRLDPDSYIMSPVEYNIFEAVKNENKTCAYIKGSKKMDNPKMALGLNAELLRFENSYEGKIVESINTIPEGLYFNTNFEICNIKTFVNSDYLKVFDHVDKSGGIYIHRWGDHIIRTAIVTMLFGQSARKEFENIHYMHNIEHVGAK